MNGMNRTILAVVSIIALLYSGLCFFLTLTNYVTGAGHPIDIYLFLPINGDLGINITDKLMEYVTYLSSGLYDQIISGIASLVPLGDFSFEFKMVLILVGFILAIAGFITKPTGECFGRTNPAQYLWTHRPNAFVRCLAMPWNIITAAWGKSKPLVIIPIILLPLYFVWSIMITILLIIPFIIVRVVVGSKIRSAAKREATEYAKNTDYGVCPNCKRNFDRPKVKCRCGLILDYPVPNIYGYKYHTCNKGHDISCESGKRSGLTTICPHCNKQIDTREALPITISFVGGTNTGKTTLMLSAVETIAKNARTVDITVDSPSAGLSKDAIAAKDYAPRTIPGELESQILFIRSSSLQDREIVFNDISGVEFQPDVDKVFFEEYYNYTDGLIFTFDPMSFNRGLKREAPHEVFESFHYMYTTIRNMPPSATSDVPFAIVATKKDICPTKLDDKDVRQYLIDNGEVDFVRIVESIFTDVKYFSICSHGDDCASAMRPVWWIVGHVDKKLQDSIPCTEIE